MKTFNPNIDALFQERFDTMASDDTSDFLGMCFGSKRCKRRRAERLKLRNQKRRANILKKQATTEGIRNGTNDGKSTIENILGSIGGLASSILGGGAGAASAAAADTADNQSANMMQPDIAQPKKKNTMLYVIIAVVVVGVIGFVLMKKK